MAKLYNFLKKWIQPCQILADCHGHRLRGDCCLPTTLSAKNKELGIFRVLHAQIEGELGKSLAHFLHVSR